MIILLAFIEITLFRIITFQIDFHDACMLRDFSTRKVIILDNLLVQLFITYFIISSCLIYY